MTPLDRLPPHSVEAEQAVLGAILQDPSTVVGRCIELLTGEQEFYDLRHQAVYRACLDLYEAGTPPDMVSLVNSLKSAQKLDQVGGVPFVATLPDCCPSSAGIVHWATIVHDKYMLRSVIQRCTEIVAMAYEHSGAAADLIDNLEREVLAIRNLGKSTEDVPIKELVKQAINEVEDEWQRKGKIGGLETGFPDLDRLTNGLQPQELAILAARPGMGKSSISTNIVEHVSVELGLPVGVFSLEMSDKSIAKRLLMSRARVNVRNVRSGFLAERDFPKITSAAAKIAFAPIYIDDAGGQSVLRVRAKARRWHREHGIKLLVVDYLQLMNAHGSSRKCDSRQQEITEISAGLKNLAKELEIPVLVLSQLNRDMEREKARKPRLSDLRESGAIEQDADLIMFLYKPNAGDDKDGKESNAVNLLIAKQRNGEAGVDVPLVFLKEFTRFESSARIEPEDEPQRERADFQ